MKRKRRTHSPEFKAKVALAVIQGELKLAELVKKYDVYANQIVDRKKQLLNSAPGVFAWLASTGSCWYGACQGPEHDDPGETVENRCTHPDHRAQGLSILLRRHRGNPYQYLSPSRMGTTRLSQAALLKPTVNAVAGEPEGNLCP